MDTPNARTPSVLLYGIEERPPLREAFFAALQHLLAIFIAIVTPPLIIAGALGLDHETTGFLVSMALFASGLSTFIQCRRIGGVGTGLLCIQGTSFSFIGPIISTGMLGGLPLIFGVCIAGAAAHNAGQILAAIAVLGSPAIAVYLAPLLLASVATGAVTGAASILLVRRVPRPADRKS